MTPEKLCGLRYEEQQNAAKVIGASSVRFLDRADGYLIPDLDLRRDVVRIIREYKPDILVTCDPQTLFATYGINHPDHRAAGQVVLDAVFPAAGNLTFFPDLLEEGFEPHMPKEIWCSLANQPNATIDVTDTWDIKLNAILEHKSQVQDAEKLVERFKSRRTEDSTESKLCCSSAGVNPRVSRLRSFPASNPFWPTKTFHNFVTSCSAVSCLKNSSPICGK